MNGIKNLKYDTTGFFENIVAKNNWEVCEFIWLVSVIALYKSTELNSKD